MEGLLPRCIEYDVPQVGVLGKMVIVCVRYYHVRHSRSSHEHSVIHKGARVSRGQERCASSLHVISTSMESAFSQKRFIPTTEETQHLVIQHIATKLVCPASNFPNSLRFRSKPRKGYSRGYRLLTKKPSKSRPKPIFCQLQKHLRR